MYTHDSSPAFSLYRFLFCFGLAGTSIVASHTGFFSISILAVATCIVSALSYWYMRYAHMPPAETACTKCDQAPASQTITSV